MRAEILFWWQNLSGLNGFSFSQNRSEVVINFEVASDASGAGVYAYQFASEFKLLLKRPLTLEKKLASSTYREILALRDIYLCDVGEKFRGGIVRHLTDNKCVESICCIGSRDPALHNIAMALYMRCRELNITLIVEWRSRDDPLIAFADRGSQRF